MKEIGQGGREGVTAGRQLEEEKDIRRMKEISLVRTYNSNKLTTIKAIREIHQQHSI